MYNRISIDCCWCHNQNSVVRWRQTNAGWPYRILRFLRIFRKQRIFTKKITQCDFFARNDIFSGSETDFWDCNLMRSVCLTPCTEFVWICGWVWRHTNALHQNYQNSGLLWRQTNALVYNLGICSRSRIVIIATITVSSVCLTPHPAKILSIPVYSVCLTLHPSKIW